MYLSHPVRQIRADPQPGESVGLVVEFDDPDGSAADPGVDAGPDALRDTVDDVDGTVHGDLGFDAYHVTVPEPAVDAVCEVGGVVRIETDATISLGLDDTDVDTGDTDEIDDDTLARMRDQLDE